MINNIKKIEHSEYLAKLPMKKPTETDFCNKPIENKDEQFSGNYI